MASFYDTAPTRFGIGPLFPRRRLPAECFPSPPVPESAPLSGFVSPLAGTARLPDSASSSTPVTIGLTGNFRPRIGVCASISLSGLVSLLCLCFLLCLPRHARTPRQPRWFRQECSLPISLAAERRTRPSCTTTHTRPVKLQGRQQPFYGCGEHFGPTAPCGGIRRGPSPH